MAETKQINKNLVILTGTLSNIEAGTTAQGFPYANIIVRSIGLKYTDNIPCVLYGSMATRLQESVAVGDSVTVYGRIREKTIKEKSLITIVVTSVKKSI